MRMTMKQIFMILGLFGILASFIGCTDDELEIEVEQLREELHQINTVIEQMLLPTENDILFAELSEEKNALKAELEECLAASGTRTAMRPYAGEEDMDITSEQLEYFLDIALESEFGSRDNSVIKWTKDLKIKIFGSPTSQDIETVEEVVNELTDIVGTAIQMEIVESYPNVEIYFVPPSDYHIYEPKSSPASMGYVWCSYDEYEIYEATILISSKVMSQSLRSHLIREELTQSLGLLNDTWQYERQDSIFYEGSSDTTWYSEIDKIIIAMLYNQHIAPGMNEEEIQLVLKPFVIEDGWFDASIREENSAKTELSNVQLSITATMAIPDPPIVNMEADKRIDSFESTTPTNDMTNGGLIMTSVELEVPSDFLRMDEAKCYYTVDASGSVHGFYDEEGLEPIEW